MTGLSRRKFLGTGIGAATAAGIGYLTKDYWYPPAQSITSAKPVTTPAPVETKANNPPFANFSLKKPRYINPCIGQDVLFENSSKDPDGNPLTYGWYVNDKLMSESKDFAFRFAEIGDPRIELKVSDGKLKDQKEYSFLHIEPDQIYPRKQLGVKYKGISYYVGGLPDLPTFPTPPKEAWDEELDTILYDLGCNAVIITAGGYFEDSIIECAKMAVEKGFEKVYVQPRYINSTADDTVAKIGEFGKKVRSLRDTSNVVSYCVGHEFSLETAIAGNTFWERFNNLVNGVGWNKCQAVMPSMFGRIIAVCNKNYGYPITYAGTMSESKDSLIPWSNPAFESVGVDAYIEDVAGRNETWVLDLLSRLKVHGKPINSTDWGLMTFSGAGKYGGMAGLYNPQSYPYDEDEQTNYIVRVIKMLNMGGINGSFYIQYFDTWDKGHGLINPNSRKRKKGYYMYKSYQRAGS